MSTLNQIDDINKKLSYKHYESFFDVFEDDNSGLYYFNLLNNIYIDCRQFNPNTYVEHEVRQEDSLYSLSLQYYKGISLWWMIAIFNGIKNPFELNDKVGGYIKIPGESLLEFILQKATETLSDRGVTV